MRIEVSYEKPIPVKTMDNAPYWDAADRHTLELQKCEGCQKAIHPAGPACPHCGSAETSWQQYGNDIKGIIYSFIISYRPFLPGFQDDLPTVIAQVELEKEPDVKIIANVIDCDVAAIKIGTPVEMTWVDITEDRALPQWRLQQA